MVDGKKSSDTHPIMDSLPDDRSSEVQVDSGRVVKKPSHAHPLKDSLPADGLSEVQVNSGHVVADGTKSSHTHLLKPVDDGNVTNSVIACRRKLN